MRYALIGNPGREDGYKAGVQNTFAGFEVVDNEART